jgi:cytochrome P450
VSVTLAPASGSVSRPDPAEEMFAWFRAMRQSQPVYLDEHDLWHVFDHADVVRVLSDPATFSSDDRAFNPPQQDIDLFAKGSIVNMDPPRHRQLRRVLSGVFTPRVVAGLAPRVEQIATTLLDEVAGRESFDLVDALAYPLPVTVIAELLGVPAHDLPQFRRWAEGLFSVQVGASTLPDEQTNALIAPIIAEMNGYLLEHIRQRRAAPGDSLLGRLATAQVDGAALEDDEIVGFAGILLLAGHITTTALLGNTVLCLGRFPEAAAQVRADPTLLPKAIEEVLRFRTPFPRLGRVTSREVRLGGRLVPARRLVMPWIGAANRDPARFRDPERFDLHRDGLGQLAFGHGIHFCIGAPLARLESRIAVDLLLRRYGDIVVDTTNVDYHNPWAMVAVKALCVRVRA